MCLAVPMEVLELTADDTRVVEIGGAKRPVNLMLVEAPQPGDYVLVHAGFAIEKLDREEAEQRLALFEELAAAERQAVS